MDRYKIFLASSGDMDEERKEIAMMIARQNNEWVDKDVYAELVIWEDLLHSLRDERVQSYFNQEMLKCDIVIVLFFNKVGEFTLEEFKLAYDNLKERKKPYFLFVFFKSASISIDDVDEKVLEVSKIKKEIKKHEQIYGTYRSMEDLIFKLHRQLEMAIFHQLETAAKDERVDMELIERGLENYKKHLYQKFRYLDFTGLNAILQKPLMLENIYVKLCAKELSNHEQINTNTNFEILFDTEDTKKVESKKERITEDFFTLFKRTYLYNRYLLREQTKYLEREEKKKKRSKKKEKEEQKVSEQLKVDKKEWEPIRMVILGHPGSGKTTLMKWIALQCLKKEERTFFSQFTPILISLKDLGIDPGNTYIQKNITSLTIYLLERENVSITAFFENQFNTGKLLFLFDGLDEIGDDIIRREVIHWLQNQYISTNSWIVTSRFSGLKQSKGLKFKSEIPMFEIQNFKMEDVDIFLRNWYRNIEIAVGGDRGTQKAIEEGKKRQAS
jgi:predicted NACHT family NTPase